MAQLRLSCGKNLNYVKARNGVPKVNFKGFMAKNALANRIAVKNIYGEGGPSLPMEGRECTCLFHQSQSLENVTQKYINATLQIQYKNLYKDYKDAKQYMKQTLNMKSFVHGRCYLEQPQKKALLCSLSGWAFGTSIISNGVAI